MHNLQKIRLIFIVLSIFGLAVIPGCHAMGNFSPKALKSGNDIIVKDLNFEEDIDLREVLEFKPTVPGVMKAVVEGHLVFENCKFYRFVMGGERDGKTYIVEFKGDVVFDNCQFRDEILMDYTVVHGDFYAGSSEFMGAASFDNAWFKGRNTIFSNAVFYGKSRFINVLFDNRAQFFKTTFQKSVLFQSAVFKGSSFWGAAKFEEYAGFGNTRFFQEVDFGETMFNSKTNFNGMTTLMSIRFNATKFASEVDFSKTSFARDPDIEGAVFEAGCTGIKKAEPENSSDQ